VRNSHHQHPHHKSALPASIEQASNFEGGRHRERDLRDKGDHHKGRKGIRTETDNAIGTEIASTGAEFARSGADEFDTTRDGFAENRGHGCCVVLRCDFLFCLVFFFGRVVCVFMNLAIVDAERNF
jgi:hypothetical protein